LIAEDRGRLVRGDEHPGTIRPLVGAGRPVLVDRHPICAVCGNGVAPSGPEGWRHVARGRIVPRSKWLSPITLKEIRRLGTYEAFRARFASGVRGDLGVAVSTSEDEWREGRRRLEVYRARLGALRRRRALPGGENPHLDLFTLLTAPPLTPGLVQILNLRDRRSELAALFSWAIPTDEALDILAAQAPLVECGAGMGYWSALLRARGVQVAVYDLAPPGASGANQYHVCGRSPWTRIDRGAAEASARRHGSHALFLCWPPYENDAASYAALRAYRGAVVVYAGERDDGATGSVRFHRELRLNWTLGAELALPHWPGLRDTLMVYRKNTTRRPHRERDRCFECRRFLRTGALGRCDWCFARRPSALALRAGAHRVEYPQEIVDAMPVALRRALEGSPNRIRSPRAQD
jgi:hypothetical protein